jgi:hypothetical protein
MRKYISRLATLASISTIAVGAFGADHIDAPATTADPAADITDLYAFMSADGKSVEFALDVAPFATKASRFSDAVQYAIHVNSSTGYGKAQTETLVVCEFSATGAIECWVGGKEHLRGDASNPTGIATQSGKVRVFAGLRNDPFFFNLDGFKHAVATVEAATGLTPDPAGCPNVNAATSAVLVGQLQHSATDGPPADTFAGKNVLAIVLEIDKSLLTAGGPTLGVWASTHRKS